MRPSTMPLASIAGALGRGSLVMTILSREGPIAPPPEDDDASARRASQPEPAAEPALEPAPYRPGKPEEHGHDGGEDQHLGGTHAAPLISPASCGTNRAGGAHNVLLARPNRRAFADYNEELRCGSRVLLDRVLLASRTLDRGRWRADALRQLVERHLAGRANDAPALGPILTSSSSRGPSSMLRSRKGSGWTSSTRCSCAPPTDGSSAPRTPPRRPSPCTRRRPTRSCRASRNRAPSSTPCCRRSKPLQRPRRSARPR